MSFINLQNKTISKLDLLDILLYLHKDKILSSKKKSCQEATITYLDPKNKSLVSGFIRILFYNNQTCLQKEDRELLSFVLNNSLNKKDDSPEIKLGTVEDIINALDWNEKENPYSCFLESLQRLYCVTIETDLFLYFGADVFSQTIFSLFSDFSIKFDGEDENKSPISITWNKSVLEWIKEYYNSKRDYQRRFFMAKEK